jgi:Holliday junction resolvase
LIDLAWHHIRPLVVLVSMLGGYVFIWAKYFTKNWNAFAPYFKELEETKEYIEKEDEFDRFEKLTLTIICR